MCLAAHTATATQQYRYEAFFEAGRACSPDSVQVIRARATMGALSVNCSTADTEPCYQRVVANHLVQEEKDCPQEVQAVSRLNSILIEMYVADNCSDAAPVEYLAVNNSGCDPVTGRSFFYNRTTQELYVTRAVTPSQLPEQRIVVDNCTLNDDDTYGYTGSSFRVRWGYSIQLVNGPVTLPPVPTTQVSDADTTYGRPFVLGALLITLTV